MVSSKIKLTFLIATIAGLSLVTVGGFIIFQQSTTSSIQLGALSGDLHHLPLFVALENDYFEEEGINIQQDDIVWFQNGNEAMIAFESGRLDISYLGLAPAMAHKLSQNAPIKIISGVNVNGSAIVVRDDSSINSISDLEGKDIAVPSLNNMQDFILQIALNNSGVNIDNVNRMTLSVGNMQSMLDEGEIDGFVAWEPHNARAVSNNAKFLNFSSEIWPNHPCCVIASSLNFLNSDPDAAEKIVKIHKKALTWMENPSNHGTLINVAKKYTGISDDSTIDIALNNIGYVYNFSSYQSEIGTFYDKLTDLNNNIDPWSAGKDSFFQEFLENSYLNT